MKYKKIYIEITNQCNLTCSFCIKNTREKQLMTKETFLKILEKIKPYTKYIYLHILGEPCIHPNINEFIKIANKDFYVNITTNGYLIENLENQLPIRQLNISIHSYHPKYKKTIKEYIQPILTKITTMPSTYISFRFWTQNPYTKELLSYLNEYYHQSITIEQLTHSKSIKLKENVFLNPSKSFIWPSLQNKQYQQTGTCYGTIDHIGILVDGTITPCCLDTKGNIQLGNILKNDLNKIQKSAKYKKIQSGFLQNKKVEELCKHCNFIQKRKRKS